MSRTLTAPREERLIELLSAAIYSCDAQGRITRFNRAAVELWGRAPIAGVDRWCGAWRTFRSDGSPLPIDQSPTAIAVREGRSVRGMELIIERPDGTRRDILSHPEPLRDAEGRVTGVINLLVDITQARMAERDQALLAAIVASSDDAIISTDLTGRITSWNGGAQRIFGYSAAEMIGRSITIIIPPDHMHEQAVFLSRLRAGRKIDHFRTVRQARDGRLVEVSLTVSPIRDGSGRVVGASKVARDVTAQRRWEEALRRSERDLSDFFENATIGLHWMDAEGRIQRVNRAELEMLGYREAEYLGRPIRDFHEDPGEAAEMLRRLKRGDAVRNWNVRLRRGDGRLLDAMIDSSAMFEQGRFVHSRCFTRDVTDQVRAREVLRSQQATLEEAMRARTEQLQQSHERLRISERMASLGTLSAGLGHDMGNLLLPVRVSIETLERADLSAPLREDVQRIRTSVEYLQRLATGLRLMALDPAKLPDGDSVDLAAWWREASLVCKNALPRGVLLEADVPAGLRAAMPKAALTQAVFNLCQNAGEALADRENGLVRVEARAEGDSVCVIVRDNGPGMSAEVRRRCLEPFFTTKPRGISTGLGLSLVNGLVSDSGGSLEIESSPGAGTTFRLRLRAAPAPLRGRSDSTGRAVVRMADPRTRAFVAAELESLAMEIVDPDTATQPVDLCVKDPSAAAPPAKRTVVLGRAGGAGESVIGQDVSTEAIRRAIHDAAASLRPHRGP